VQLLPRHRTRFLGKSAAHAAGADIKQLPNLLHGEETVLYGDQAYWKEVDRHAFEERGVRYRVNRRAAGGNKEPNNRWRKINRARSRSRARCEDAFRVIKEFWAFE
jgi:IS5 family transposase